MTGQGTMVISGGARGLGAVIARRALDQGYRAVLTGRQPTADLDELGRYGDVSYQRVDTRDGGGLAELFAGIDDLAAAVANAAVYRGGSVVELSEQHWREVIDINLTGSFLFGQAAARRFVETGRDGGIVFVGTWAQQVPDWETGVYSASKAGVTMLAKTMALELAERGVRVNVVAPGIVGAGMAARRIDTDAAYAARARRTIPLGRLQTADEVADATLFLCSPAASYLTGSVLLADGGASLRPGGHP